VPTGDDRLVEQLKDALKDRGRRAKILYLPRDPKKSGKEFALEVDLGRAPNAAYSHNFVPPPPIIEWTKSKAPPAEAPTKEPAEKLDPPAKVEKKTDVEEDKP